MILFISQHDYANFGHNMANAYRKIRADVKDYTLHPHKFSYPSQSQILKKGDVERAIERATQIHIMHSDPLVLKMVQRFNRSNAELIVWHTGTRYRQEPDRFNDLFNPVVSRSIMALTEIMGLGAKDEYYIVGAIDTDTLRPGKTISSPPEIYHLPSDPKTKGTDTIFEIVRNLKGSFNFEYKLDPSPYHKQLEIMSRCDIYLELFASYQFGKPYGSWGITALEAAAMGKVVFTQHNAPQPYIDAYGQAPALECHSTAESFRDALQMYIDRPNLIKMKQAATRKWVVDHHSMRATGLRMKAVFG